MKWEDISRFITASETPRELRTTGWCLPRNWRKTWDWKTILLEFIINEINIAYIKK